MLSVVVMLLCCFHSLADLMIIRFSYRCRGVTAHYHYYMSRQFHDIFFWQSREMSGSPFFNTFWLAKWPRSQRCGGLEAAAFQDLSLTSAWCSSRQLGVTHLFIAPRSVALNLQTSRGWKTGSEEIKSWLGLRRQVGSNSVKRRTDGLQVRLDLWPSPSWTKRMPALTRCSAQTPGEICQIRGSKSTSRFAGPQFQTWNVVKNVCKITIL